MTEKYNAKAAAKCTTLSLLVNITFVLMINFTLAFQHNSFDTSNIHLKLLFNDTSYSTTTVIGTYIIYICQNVNIYMYSVMKQKNLKIKWLKHNLNRLITSLIAYALIKSSVYIVSQLYPSYDIDFNIKGSSIFILVIMVIDSFIYHFLTSLKVQET
ncbi:VUT family protein [Borrelia sp. P9F1]|uniref:VUT family protein n=1 Tax=Borrelia sp. P9F1 TaxID=3058374 RepID=UPI00264943F0|nr:VUT family protein [Borrelia sp. P9F1]WKC58399.1 VUT family protein [Borrelia sp. P9F1]